MPQQTRTKVHSRPTQDSTQRSADDDVVDEAVDAAKRRTRPESVEHTDELLDEIDAVLEENALEVVTRYIQKGGQ